MDKIRQLRTFILAAWAELVLSVVALIGVIWKDWGPIETAAVVCSALTVWVGGKGIKGMQKGDAP